MKLKCAHGYFILEETDVGQAAQFAGWSGLTLVPKDNYFTFEKLQNAPSWSIKGTPYLGALATVTFEGKPWEVMQANGLVYNFTTGLVVPILSVVQVTTVEQGHRKFLSPGLILPGSVTADGKRVKDYVAWFSKQRQTFLYSEVGYV